MDKEETGLIDKVANALVDGVLALDPKDKAAMEKNIPQGVLPKPYVQTMRVKAVTEFPDQSQKQFRLGFVKDDSQEGNDLHEPGLSDMDYDKNQFAFYGNGDRAGELKIGQYFKITMTPITEPESIRKAREAWQSK